MRNPPSPGSSSRSLGAVWPTPCGPLPTVSVRARASSSFSASYSPRRANFVTVQVVMAKEHLRSAASRYLRYELAGSGGKESGRRRASHQVLYFTGDILLTLL
jgi:hypothetical protein